MIINSRIIAPTRPRRMVDLRDHRRDPDRQHRLRHRRWGEDRRAQRAAPPFALELEAALEENAGLHAQLVAQAREAGVTDERQRIAGEIHDTIAQGLTGVITQLEAANQVKSDPAELQRRLDNATSLARESLAEARRSMRAILPAPLEGRQLRGRRGGRGGTLVVAQPAFPPR